MTKINDVLTSVKRGRMTIDELKTEFTESLNLLHDGLSNIEQPLNEIANFEKEQNEILEKYQSSNTALSKEVNSLQQGKEQNEQLLANTQDTLEEKTDQ
ncbi:MAG: hypothetical protein U9O98_00385, partial [Asgard group archaeon]|nr:hypothetical protein [Asgard group archaeon]